MKRIVCVCVCYHQSSENFFFFFFSTFGIIKNSSTNNLHSESIPLQKVYFKNSEYLNFNCWKRKIVIIPHRLNWKMINAYKQQANLSIWERWRRIKKKWLQWREKVVEKRNLIMYEFSWWWWSIWEFAYGRHFLCVVYLYACVCVCDLYAYLLVAHRREARARLLARSRSSSCGDIILCVFAISIRRLRMNTKPTVIQTLIVNSD